MNECDVRDVRVLHDLHQWPHVCDGDPHDDVLRGTFEHHDRPHEMNAELFHVLLRNEWLRHTRIPQYR